VNFVSNVRGTVPTGSTQKMIAPIRGGPAGAGVANTVPDSTYFVRRPYTTLGITGHFDGGASIRILPLLNFRASAYAIEPSGQQKLFSKFLNRQMGPTGNPGASHSGRVFQTTPETIGSADIARDHGFSLGFDSSPVVRQNSATLNFARVTMLQASPHCTDLNFGEGVRPGKADMFSRK
jgi:hypothetical protein